MKPCSVKNAEFRHKLPSAVESNVTLTFLKPAGLMFVMPAKLVKNILAALTGCHPSKFLSVSMQSMSIIIWPL